MANARKTLGWPVNRKVLDVASPDEMAYWTNRFHVSQSVLKKVVQLVGPKFRDVAVFVHRLRSV